ncbi:metacaspase-like protein [Plasmodium vinckei vinckei]|uniref:Metacaspase-like protein n=1 Tax=Plasmodium vinckei vinckei TaxID=54757 RepID=A0A449BU71_PLAVN|nr:metacaspase-like protein [Plasmodium vinckei vinckei]VEV56971.1 metacaspase-like protein [Plasmodium vinckei vinckei]
MAYYDYKNSLDKKKKNYPLKNFVDLYEIKNSIKLDKCESSENCTYNIDIMKKNNQIVCNSKKNRKNENCPNITTKSVSPQIKVFNDIYKTHIKGYSTDYNNDEYMKKNSKDNKLNFSKNITNLNKNKTSPIYLFSNITDKNNNKINMSYFEDSKKEMNYDNIINEGNNHIEKLMKNFKNSKRNANLLSIYLDNCKYDINKNNTEQIKYKKIMNTASEISKTHTKKKNIYESKFLQNEKSEYDKNQINSDTFYQHIKYENCNINRNELKNNSHNVLKQIDKIENIPNPFWNHNLDEKKNDNNILFNRGDINKNRYCSFQNERKIFPDLLKDYEMRSIKTCDNLSNSPMIYLKNKSDIYVEKNIYINNNENNHRPYLDSNRHRGNRVFTDIIPQVKLKNNIIYNPNVDIEINNLNKHNYSNYNNKYEDKNLNDNKMYYFPKKNITDHIKNNNFHRMAEGNIKNKLETNYHIRNEENNANIFEKKEDDVTYNDYIMEKTNEIHSEHSFKNLRCYINGHNNNVYVVKKNELSKIIDGNLCENKKNKPFEYGLSKIIELNQNENKDASKFEGLISDGKTHIFSKNKENCKNDYSAFNPNGNDGNKERVRNDSLEIYRQHGNINKNCNKIKSSNISNVSSNCLFKEGENNQNVISTNPHFQIDEVNNNLNLQNEEQENIEVNIRDYIKDTMKDQKIKNNCSNIKCCISNNDSSTNYMSKYLNNENIYVGTNGYKQYDNNIEPGEYPVGSENNNHIYQNQYEQINLNDINKDKLIFSNTFFQSITKENIEHNYMKKNEINNNTFQAYKMNNLIKLNSVHIPVLKNQASKKNTDIIPIAKVEKVGKENMFMLPSPAYNNNNKGIVKPLYSSKTIVSLPQINKESISDPSNKSKTTLPFPNLLLHKNNILNNHQSITKMRNNTTLNNGTSYEMMQKNIIPKTSSISYGNINGKNKMFKFSELYNKGPQNGTNTIKDNEGNKNILFNKTLYNKGKCDDNILVKNKLTVCKSINNSDIYNYLKNTNSLKNYHRTASYRKQSLKNAKSITKNIKLVPKGNDIISMNHERQNKMMNNTIDLHTFYSRCEIESIDNVKKAAVIGCNYMGEKDSKDRLHGSVNDAYVFSRALIKYFNFLPENVLLLIDSFPSNAYIYDDFDMNRGNYINGKNDYNCNEEKVENKYLFNLFNKKNINDNKEMNNDYENNNSCVDVDIKNVDLSSKNIDFSLWPTRINILKAVNWLVRDSVPNGSYVFYYAGKSIQVDNMSGWEGEGYDEAFLCSDPFNRDEENNILTAIQLKDILLSINPTAQMTIILDTSGGQTILDPAGTENSSYIKGCKQKGIWPITNPTNKVHKAIYDITILDNSSMKKYMCKPRYSKLIEVDSTSAMIDPLLQSISSFPLPTKAYCLCAATWEQISIEGLFPIFEFARVAQKKKKNTLIKPAGNNSIERNREDAHNSVKKNMYEPNIGFNISTLSNFFTVNNKKDENNASESVKTTENYLPDKISDKYEEDSINYNEKYSIIKDNNEYNSNKFNGNNNYVLVFHGVFTYCLVESIMEFKKKELNDNIFEKEFQEHVPMTLKNLISQIQKKIQIIKNTKLKKLNQKPEFTIHPGANASINNYFISYSKNINFHDFNYFYLNEDMSPFLNVNKAWEEINKRTLRNRKLLYATSTLVNTSSKYLSQTNKIKNSCSLKY